MSNFVSSETQNLNLYSCPNLLAYLLTSLHVGLYEMLMAMKSTRSSSLVTLACPSTSSFLRITDRFFQHASPRLWYQLPATLRQPRTNLPMSDSPIVLWVALLPSVPSTHHSHHPSPPHFFIPGLKPSFSAKSSHYSLPFLLQDWLHGFLGLFTDTSKHIRFLLFSFSFFRGFSFYFMR